MSLTTETEKILRREQFFPRPRDEVFAFFREAGNLERITPAFLNFRVLNPDAVLGEGTLLDYRLALFGFPFSWRTRIEEWKPTTCFVDRQVAGPYAQWHHTHLFEDEGSGTRMIDIVRYRVGWGVLGPIADLAMVRWCLRVIFDHRARVAARMFGSPGRHAQSPITPWASVPPGR